ncbi:hypothetical protein DFH07DRAFT_783335 [Mycena maculata]|uniref:Uncharacterized protein n=1 Tax=Mycena maculata TaxID=230809 RepID=A0AAD7HMU0_9AGAR|nr:hypothetical protein DFH07DRAFT_783335 [Mycena maculata]
MGKIFDKHLLYFEFGVLTGEIGSMQDPCSSGSKNLCKHGAYEFNLITQGVAFTRWARGLDVVPEKASEIISITGALVYGSIVERTTRSRYSCLGFRPIFRSTQERTGEEKNDGIGEHGRWAPSWITRQYKLLQQSAQKPRRAYPSSGGSHCTHSPSSKLRIHSSADSPKPRMSHRYPHLFAHFRFHSGTSPTRRTFASGAEDMWIENPKRGVGSMRMREAQAIPGKKVFAVVVANLRRRKQICFQARFGRRSGRSRKRWSKPASMVSNT